MRKKYKSYRHTKLSHSSLDGTWKIQNLIIDISRIYLLRFKNMRSMRTVARARGRRFCKLIVFTIILGLRFIDDVTLWSSTGTSLFVTPRIFYKKRKLCFDCKNCTAFWVLDTLRKKFHFNNFIHYKLLSSCAHTNHNDPIATQAFWM